MTGEYLLNQNSKEVSALDLSSQEQVFQQPTNNILLKPNQLSAQPSSPMVTQPVTPTPAPQQVTETPVQYWQKPQKLRTFFDRAKGATSNVFRSVAGLTTKLNPVSLAMNSKPGTALISKHQQSQQSTHFGYPSSPYSAPGLLNRFGSHQHLQRLASWRPLANRSTSVSPVSLYDTAPMMLRLDVGVIALSHGGGDDEPFVFDAGTGAVLYRHSDIEPGSDLSGHYALKFQTVNGSGYEMPISTSTISMTRSHSRTGSRCFLGNARDPRALLHVSL